MAASSVRVAKSPTPAGSLARTALTLPAQQAHAGASQAASGDAMAGEAPQQGQAIQDTASQDMTRQGTASQDVTSQEAGSPVDALPDEARKEAASGAARGPAGMTAGATVPGTTGSGDAMNRPAVAGTAALPDARQTASGASPLPGNQEMAQASRPDSRSARQGKSWPDSAPAKQAAPGSSDLPDTSEAPPVSQELRAYRKPEAPRGGKGWFLQLGAFRQLDNALRAQREQQARTTPADPPLELEQQGNHYRVLLGPYASEGEARAAAAEIGTRIGHKPGVMRR